MEPYGGGEGCLVGGEVVNGTHACGIHGRRSVNIEEDLDTRVWGVKSSRFNN